MRGALGLLGRRSLRANRRAILGLALVIALAGGVALASLAAARRTASAFPRYLASAHASDVAFNVVSPDPSEGVGAPSSCAGCPRPGAPARLSRADGFAAAQSYVGLENVFVLGGNAELTDTQPEVVGSLDGRFLDQDQLAIQEGRLPRTSRADEVAINQQAADALGLHPGSTVHLAVPDLSNRDLPPDKVRILARATVRVTGIGLFPEEVLSDDIDGSPRLLTTPALTARLRALAGTYVWQGVRLADGVRVDDAIRAFDARLAKGFRANVQRTDTQVERVQRSVRPLALALGVFGGAAAVAALGLGLLGTVRLVAATTPATDRAALEGMGLPRRQRAVAAATPALVATALGGLGAMALAVALSPLGPIGAVRQVEPNRGMTIDTSVLLLGAAVLVVLVSAAALASAVVATRRSGIEGANPSRPSWFVGRLAAAGLGPAAVVGARHAFGGDGQRDGVPTRSMLASGTLCVVAVVSALTFGANVRTLLRSPASYGWSADLAVVSGGGYDEMHLADAGKAARTRGIDALTVAGFATVGLGRLQVNAVGIAPVEGRPLVTVVDGRLPHSRTEVALGASTARDLSRNVGEDVRGPRGPLRIVGIVALPAVGPAASSHPSLGQGALFTVDGLQAADHDAYTSMVLVRLSGGEDVERSQQRITTAVATAMSESPPDFADSVSHLRPSEVIGLGPASRTAYEFAAVLGAAAVLALALTLSASARRRRGTYAMLSALGMDRHQLRRSVRWQLNLLVLVTLVLGVPLGLAAGRVAWTAFAHLLGTTSDPKVPVLALVAVVGGLVALGNLVGAWPARMATRPQSLALRRD